MYYIIEQPRYIGHCASAPPASLDPMKLVADAPFARPTARPLHDHKIEG